MKIDTSEREIDVRVSILPTVHGEKVVLRLLGSGQKEVNLSKLGFPDDKLKTTFKKARHHSTVIYRLDVVCLN